MASNAFPASYYAATANPFPRQPSIEGAVEADVCVVGGGIAGCSTALHLAERGYQVALLEGERIGWGASGRSGGQVLPGFSVAQDKLVRLVGRQTANALWDISVEGVALMRELINRYDIDCDWADGQLSAAIKPRHRDELLAWQEELERDHAYVGTRMVEGPELRSLVATERYVAGLFDPHSGHVHPLNYTLGLARAALQRGVQVYESSRAESYERQGDRLRVRTARGEVRCRHLALCGNVYLGELGRELQSKIMSVGTYVVATEPLGEERARSLIPNNMAVTDLNWILDYFRRSSDHRLLFGGRVSYSGIDPNTAQRTRARMVKVFPQLADVRIDYSWGGYLDITLNRAPHFGRLEHDVYFLQGFSGHGIALTGIGGKLIAEAIAGTAERFDMFARIPHTGFPGGALLRRPALVLAMLYYRLRDAL